MFMSLDFHDVCSLCVSVGLVGSLQDPEIILIASMGSNPSETEGTRETVIHLLRNSNLFW